MELLVHPLQGLVDPLPWCIGSVSERRSRDHQSDHDDCPKTGRSKPAFDDRLKAQVAHAAIS
jgi:hypothetical protein